MTDFAAQRLRANGDPARLDEILQQECHQRFGSKLAHTLAAVPGFRFPSLLAGEQATSDLLAAERARWLTPGARVLDMTCGLGIDALHLAESGCRVTAIEMDAQKAECASANFAAAGVDVTVVCADSTKWLAEYEGVPFDAIFIDPARRTTSGRAYSLADCTPDAAALMPLMLTRAAMVIVKASPMLDVNKTRQDLGHDADIILTGTPTECRELCAVLPGHGHLQAVTLTPGGRVCVNLDRGPQTAAGAEPVPGQYICEPWPAVMKGGHALRLAYLTGTVAIAQNTNLFIADHYPKDFPGKVYRIDAVFPSGKAAIRALKGVAAQVAVRNYPMRADALAKKLQARQNDAQRLYALTAPSGHLLVLTSPQC